MVTQEVCPRPGKCVRLVTFKCTAGEARLKHVCSTGGSVIQFVQFSHSVVSNSLTPWTATHQASLSFTISWRLLKFMSIGLVMPSNHLFLSPPSPVLNLSQHQSPYSESALHIRWPKYWSFSFSISSSNRYLGLISFRIDWFDFLAIQGSLKSLLQHHGSKALILQCSAFFMVGLSHPYRTGKTITLTIQT